MPDKEDKEKTAPSTGRPRRLMRSALRILVMLAVPAALAAAGAYYYVTGGRYVSTENAYVKSDKIVISSDVSERVVEVEVDENAEVEAGQLLFRLDEEPFRIALARARSHLDTTRQEIEARRAEYRQKLAERTIAVTDVEYYGREFERQKKLNAKGFASQSKFDAARRDLLTARQRIAAIHQEIARVRADLGGDPDAPIDRHPKVREAMAVRDRAALDLRRTVVRAPASGIVTNFDLQPGEFVAAATPVFSLVGTETLWIRANIRETNLTHVRVGQEATVRVDAYPGRVWRAAVASISPATGAEFAILPPQNATGNWVKVIQRVPVRLELLTIPEDPPLRTGMSVVVEIDTGFERVLPGLVTKALAWVKGEQ